MKWKIKEPAPKQSISSNNSMSFLTDDALTFHRFSDGSISINDRRKSSENVLNGNISKNNSNSHVKRSDSVISNANSLNNSKNEVSSSTNTKGKNKKNIEHFSPTIWTTNSMKSHNGTSGTNNEFQFIASPGGPDSSSSNKNNLKNSSTAKLMTIEDQPTKQSRCSIFRGVLLCLCLNLTYANIVRFPRELERNGSAFLVPYFVLLIFIGLPLVLLEIALGQFLGQGSAHTWRASPFFRGACIVGRIASWLSTVWISLQAAIAVLFIGFLSFKEVPFSNCIIKNKIFFINKTDTESYGFYKPEAKPGQQCIRDTFFTPVWNGSFYFGLLALSLIFVWVISMLCTHSGKVNRRSIYFLGFISLVLLSFETGWEVTASINEQFFPDMWPFNLRLLYDSNLWYNALVQIIYSTNIGVGVLPVLTGKFLYKGDAVRTSIVYICFNVLINAIAVTYFLTQFNIRPPATPSQVIYDELTTITTIYDHALINRSNQLIARLLPGISYILIVISCILTISVYIYTSSKIIRRHPTYSMCLAGLVFAMSALICPDYIPSRMFDSVIVGALIICAMIFDMIAIAWVYGAKNLYTDLEFSIGRPIFKFWIIFWIISPVILISILLWWAIAYVRWDIPIDYIPRWAPIVFSIIVIFIFACVEISKEVDYNFCSMIKASTKPSKNWGPGDPLVRHAWKQWRSVCEDTGERDFTLRRRGTRDYTNSIKRGQYPHARYETSHKTSTAGSNSPNYSGSMFGDSAIEEDMSVDKFSNYQQQLPHFSNDSPKSSGQTSSYRSRKLSSNIDGKRKISESSKGSYLIRPNDNHTNRIEILADDSQNFQRISVARNPMARADSNPNYHMNYQENYGSFPNHQNGVVRVNGSIPTTHTNEVDLYWRKFSGNSEEYSTEL